MFDFSKAKDLLLMFKSNADLISEYEILPQELALRARELQEGRKELLLSQRPLPFICALSSSALFTSGHHNTFVTGAAWILVAGITLAEGHIGLVRRAYKKTQKDLDTQTLYSNRPVILDLIRYDRISKLQVI